VVHNSRLLLDLSAARRYWPFTCEIYNYDESIRFLCLSPHYQLPQCDSFATKEMSVKDF